MKLDTKMTTRYSRRAADGTTEYHDRKETLIEADRRENSEDRAGLFGFVGLLLGGILAYTAFHKLGGMDLPKWFRFSGVVVGAGVGAIILAKLADFIWGLIMTLILLGIIYGIGALIWRTV